mmetsp:Transcript_20065/g.51092  ORF Transcript_20065/g.51092 Transcript_20065/m.51092 type:complete len:203 (+) Transcript_20065:970-1578(+)
MSRRWLRSQPASSSQARAGLPTRTWSTWQGTTSLTWASTRRSSRQTARPLPWTRRTRRVACSLTSRATSESSCRRAPSSAGSPPLRSRTPRPQRAWSRRRSRRTCRRSSPTCARSCARASASGALCLAQTRGRTHRTSRGWGRRPSQPRSGRTRARSRSSAPGDARRPLRRRPAWTRSPRACRSSRSTRAPRLTAATTSWPR